jgi:hypothetical protein
MSEEKQTAGMLTVRQAAQLLKMTTERVRQLSRDGWIPKAARGAYPLVASVHGYIEFLRDEARRSNQNIPANRARDARAREIELRIAEREGHLIPTDEALAVMDEIVALCRTELQTIAARSSSDVATRREIEKQSNESLRRISDKLASRSSDVRAGVSAVQADAEDDA